MTSRLLCAAASLLLISSAIAASGDATAAAGRRRAVRIPLPCAAAFTLQHSDVIDVAVDRTHVYFGAGESVKRVPKAGGAAEVVHSIGGTWAMFVAVDEANVYFVSRNRSTSFDTIMAVPKTGGTAIPLLEGVFPYEMIPDRGWLYVVTPGTMTWPGMWNPDGRVLRVRTDGSAVETIASSLHMPMGMLLDGNDIYFSEGGTSSADQSGGLRRVSKVGGAVTSLANIPGALMIAHDATNVYVFKIIASDLGAIDVVSKSDGAVTPLLSSIAFDVLEPLSFYGDSLYFYRLRHEPTNLIEAIRPSTGERRTIAEVNGGFPQFTIDDCGVYYSTATSIERAEH